MRRLLHKTKRLGRKTSALVLPAFTFAAKRPFVMLLCIFLLLAFLGYLETMGRLPFKSLNAAALADSGNETSLPAYLQTELQRRENISAAAARQSKIAKVETFFQLYGSQLVGYGHIFVDQAEACGGDYSILVGIAGSESGLGRIPVLTYNPFGYLDGVQYESWEAALTSLGCKVSQQHIAPCGQDLYCLANRYAGAGDDHQHFIDKVAWFAQQVR